MTTIPTPTAGAPSLTPAAARAVHDPMPGRRSPATTLRVGILAPEFTTQHGGMQELARELVGRLATMARCELVVRSDRAIPESVLPPRAILRNDLRAARRALAGAPQPDVWLALNAGAAALAPFLGAPLVVYVNGNDLLEPWFGFAPPLTGWLEGVPALGTVATAVRRRAFRRTTLRGVAAARRIVANSSNTAALVRQRLGPGAPPIGVVEPGVSDGFFRAGRDAARRERPAGAPLHLLTVTRLSTTARRKNVDGVLRAITRLPHETVARYTVVGDGDDRPRLERLAAELGIAGRVTFTGPLPREALVERYEAADLFVLAARATARDVEGFGIVYLEASAGGVPVLASRAGGATDAVVEGENGFLVADASPAAIAAGIAAVHAGDVAIDPARARAVAERYRWSRVTERLFGELGGGW